MDQPQNTSKVRAILGGAISAVTSVIAWLATVPPEQQSGILAPFVELTPVSWRPAVGLVMKALAAGTGFYAVYQAAHSGPQTKPTNPPNQ